VTGSVLVTQQYFEQTEKEVYDETMRASVRKYIQPGTEFRPLESYGAHVVLMSKYTMLECLASVTCMHVCISLN
jgi:hypothetical protein